MTLMQASSRVCGVIYSLLTTRKVNLTVVIVTCILVLCDVRTVCGQYSGDDCDWSGSGLSPGVDKRGIQPVYLRCSQGKIQWKYPRGGLRVVLKHGTSGKEFKGCVRANRRFSGARIYLEGHRTLHPLYSKDDNKHDDLPRCFVSHRGQVALYIESEPVTDTKVKHVAEFSYDLRLRNKENIKDDFEECRPCSEDELLLSYCISDFVVEGAMTGINNNKELERTEISVRTSRIVRETHPVLDAPFSNDEIKSGLKTANRDKNTRNATFHIPLKCGAQIGDGQFLFLGRTMLGNPVLQCAPRIEDWHRIRSKALKEFKNQCLLD